MRSQSRCSRPRVLATEGFPDPCSPRAHPPARHHHGHASPSPASGQTPWRSQRRQGLRQQGAVSQSGTRQGAGGRKQRAGGRGNLEPAEASVPRPAPAPDPHHPPRAVAQPLAAPAVCHPGGRGWGGDWVVGVAGQQDQAGWFAQHPEAPQRLAGADAFSDRRRARAAARQQVRVSRGGCGGRQPLAAAERRRQILVKWQKMFLEKIVVFRAFGGRLGLCWWAQAWGPPPRRPAQAWVQVWPLGGSGGVPHMPQVGSFGPQDPPWRACLAADALDHLGDAVAREQAAAKHPVQATPDQLAATGPGCC